MPARLTPYEIAFGEARFEEEIFPAIRDESAGRNVDTSIRDRFLMLGAVGSLLRDLRPEGLVETGDASLPPPGAVRQYGALLFHAFRFWAAGRRLLTVDAPLVRDLVSNDAAGEWQFAAPHSAGYLQLPRHLFWARIEDEAPAEAVDGFFWSCTSGELDLLVALGMHPGRPGFSVIEAGAPLPAPPPGHWGDRDARDGARDFANILPGGELRELLAIVSGGELLKLVSRIFHYADSNPSALQPDRGETSPEDAEPAHALPASSIESVRITSITTD